ncbi:glycosyltransferase family 2 protein [Galbitalea soli]|uniref:Glycosyltransferase n=1 Tax=Galbitalea soli TaxID=1268042 RepID=A0A7C9PM61_9MICO|nr:glycosyltransferase family 2 protein [Galbitalea soli]NEM90712.1 glycosyltransferase [Galbitalea soli]NYJ31430.1 cellulose synthase/poly-beta-1,6-N-acetylglucosamine synthase-like glycosyltransferase [Galbitalea soli]
MTRAERACYRVLMTLGGATGLAFYAWWLQPEHLPHNASGLGHLLDVGIFAVLTAVLSHRAFMELYTWVVIRRIEPRRAAPRPQEGLRVAFITTFVPGAEGLDLLARTLPGMLAADYPHDTWLLDEGGDEDARALCEALGVRYFSRRGIRAYNLVAGPFTAKTKGGNHNAWYEEVGHEYDVVAQIDTDFVPRRDFLTATLGYFRDPRIGWIGTPQIYGNTDSFIARGAAQQQFGFYGPVMRGLSGRRTANMIGANHVVRVAALADIRFYAGHLTEDLLTGMRLHAAGWRSVYVPEPLAIGEGPETWQAYFSQQMRWASGCMDVLRWHSPRLVRRMPRAQALLSLALQQGYFSGLASALGIALLAAYFFGGIEISRVPLLGLIEWGGPFLAMRVLILLWMQRFTVRPTLERGLHLAGHVLSLAAWPIYLLAFVGVARSRPLAFRVTPKGGVSQRSVGLLRLFRPHLVLALVSLACVVAGLLRPEPSAVLMAWAIINTVTLGSFVVMATLATIRRRGRGRARGHEHPPALSRPDSGATAPGMPVSATAP